MDCPICSTELQDPHGQQVPVLRNAESDNASVEHVDQRACPNCHSTFDYVAGALTSGRFDIQSALVRSRLNRLPLTVASQQKITQAVERGFDLPLPLDFNF